MIASKRSLFIRLPTNVLRLSTFAFKCRTVHNRQSNICTMFFICFLHSIYTGTSRLCFYPKWKTKQHISYFSPKKKFPIKSEVVRLKTICTVSPFEGLFLYSLAPSKFLRRCMKQMLQMCYVCASHVCVWSDPILLMKWKSLLKINFATPHLFLSKGIDPW